MYIDQHTCNKERDIFNAAKTFGNHPLRAVPLSGVS